jgi:SNF2 family DNA or RNA helicase
VAARNDRWYESSQPLLQLIIRNFTHFFDFCAAVKYHGSQKDRVGMRSDFGERSAAIARVLFIRDLSALMHHMFLFRYEVSSELGIYSSSTPQEPIYDANGARAAHFSQSPVFAVISFAGRAVVPWHVMITTYSYFEADTGSPDRAFLRSIPFDVMALDEAHNIKNAASSRHR